MVNVLEHDVFGDFEEFLKEVQRRPHIRLVKLDDQGLVEPARKGRAIIMQPRVRIVVTALDDKKPEILRWEKKWDVGSGVVTIDAFTGRGKCNDPTGKLTRAKVKAALEARSLLVSDGEWTKQSAEAALDG